MKIILTIIICLMSAQLNAGGLREGGKYQEHSKFSWPADCILAMSFDEGPDAKDWSGDENNGTVSGATHVLQEGIGAYDFNGSSDFISMSMAGSLNLSGSFSICVWVNAHDPNGSSQAVVAAWKWDTDISYLLLVHNVGNKTRLIIKTTSAIYQHTTAPSIDSSVWYHIVGTYDGSYIRLYIDGVESATAVSTAGTLVQAPNYPLYIGKEYNGSHFDGNVADAQIYARCLSLAEIKMLYEKGKAGRQ